MTYCHTFNKACVASILAIDPQLNPPPPGHTQRSKFSAEDLERLVCLAAEEELWSKPHGQITSSWKGILKRLQSEGRFQTSSITTIQNKLNALVAWIIGLLEKISASKAATEKKVKDQKESLQKAGLVLYPYARTC